jgi:hypothetical protein
MAAGDIVWLFSYHVSCSYVMTSRKCPKQRPGVPEALIFSTPVANCYLYLLSPNKFNWLDVQDGRVWGK